MFPGVQVLELRSRGAKTVAFLTDRHLCSTVPTSSNNIDLVVAGFVMGGEVLEGGFGGNGEDFPCRLEADDAFEGRDGALAEGRNEFLDFVARHVCVLRAA